MKLICRGRVFLGGSFLLFLFVSIAHTQAQRSDPFLSAIEKMKHSVVPVICGHEDGHGGFTIDLIDGSGFVIDANGHFLTAGHVIHDLMKLATTLSPPCVTAIYVPDSGWQRDAKSINFHWFRFVNCQSDETLDLAVCKTLLTLTNVQPVTFDAKEPTDGSPIAFTGFPLGSIQPLSSRGNIATYRGVTDETGPKELVMDKGTWPGASGSPIYDGNGNVLGIILQRGTNEGVGIAVARPTGFILKFLRDKGISPKASTYKAEKRKQR